MTHEGIWKTSQHYLSLLSRVDKMGILWFGLYTLWFRNVLVAALTPLQAKKLRASIHIRSGVEFQANSNEGIQVQSATAALSYFPRDSWLQEVLSMNVDGQPAPTGGVLEKGTFNGDSMFELHWNDPPSNQCFFDVSAVVETTNDVVPVRNKIQFPISLRDPSMDCFLKRNYEIVNRSPQIERLAQRLVSNTDDLYHAVVQLADWVHTNIKYSLETESVEVYRYHKQKIQSSAQVLQNGYGKCDEQTALFLSLSRSVGIPARFCRGYSFVPKPAKQTETGSSEWGGHAWAEVFFPGVGWVPFDITKGEFGYLSCGNILLGISEDATDYTVEYSARGRSVNLVTKPLDTAIQTEDIILKKRGYKGVQYYLETPTETVPFGSTAMFHATLQNDNDYYACPRVEIADTVGARLIRGDAVSNVVLNPYEVKTIQFEFEISEHNLRSGYAYEFPFSLHSADGKEVELCINVAEDARSSGRQCGRSGSSRSISRYGDYQSTWFEDNAPLGETEELEMENLVKRQTFQPHIFGDELNHVEKYGASSCRSQMRTMRDDDDERLQNRGDYFSHRSHPHGNGNRRRIPADHKNVRSANARNHFTSSFENRRTNNGSTSRSSLSDEGGIGGRDPRSESMGGLMFQEHLHPEGGGRQAF